MPCGHYGERKALVTAAVLAGLAGILLTALGWWLRGWEYSSDPARLRDPGWWAGIASHVLGYLAFGKFGVKVALALSAGLSCLGFWIRAARRR